MVEEVAADGGFLLHHFSGMFLKGGQAVCLVSFSQILHHYAMVARRLGVALDRAKAQKRFLFVNALSPVAGTSLPATEPGGGAITGNGETSFRLDM